MRRSTVVAGAATLLLAVTACGSSSSTGSTTTSAPSATTSTSPAATTSTTSAMAEKDIVDTAVGAGTFTTLATALTAAGLVDTLKGPGPFTVFAPDDKAFAKLPDGTLKALLADPKGKLSKILTYHVVPGKVMAADVVKLNGQTVDTVNGAKLTVRVMGDKVTLTDVTGATVTVTATDVAASNGVIHVIDSVLLPSK
ncbi:MAG: fasciclin domain-containing protein [Austwickia sp.]|nr:fasciclin domain-containing protein [Austwickia sp.]